MKYLVDVAGGDSIAVEALTPYAAALAALQGRPELISAGAQLLVIRIATTDGLNVWEVWFGDGPNCSVCGCSQNNACDGGCFWANANLCSSCAGEESVA